MTTNILAKRLTIQLKRRVRASEINRIAPCLGKFKTKKSSTEGISCYHWTENEINNVIKLITL